MSFACSVQGQMLSGRIVDVQGQSIPNVTIFIRETTHGIMADERGEFQTKIDAGTYTMEVSSLGYERQTKTISVPPEGLKINIELKEKFIELREVTVTPNKEDPAYRIMRHVIARAPYHLHQVKSYDSDVYFKGAFIVDKVPALIRSQIKEPEVKNTIGKLLVYESQNEIKYREPDQYEQRLIALSTTIPESFHFDDDLPLIALKANIYDPKVFGGLMGPGSFSVYKFHLEESYRENDLIIHQIRIIPRKNNGQLVNGHLYIVDQSWTIQRTSLVLSQAGITLQFNLSYHEVKPGAFLPSASDVNMDMSIMGIKGNGKFFASIKYNHLETNDNPTLANAEPATTVGYAVASLKNMANQADAVQKTQSKKQQKQQQQIETLSAKEQLTTREAYKMAQLVEKSVATDTTTNQKRRLDLTSSDTTRRITRDSLALVRDSSFWNKTRVLPLREDEIRSYQQRDSLRHATDSLRSADSLKNRTFGKWMSHLFLGDRIDFGKKYFIQYNGLLSACREYNYVDGFRIGQRLTMGVRFDRPRSVSDNATGEDSPDSVSANASGEDSPGYVSANASEITVGVGNNPSSVRSFTVSPAVYYTTARQQVDFVIDGRLTYAPLRRGNFSISTGNTVADYAGRIGPGRFGNALSSIVYAGNTAKFYQKRFVTVSNNIDIANGLILTTGFDYEKRNDLENNTSFNFMKRQPAINRPHGQTGQMPDHSSYRANIDLQYTPQYYYRIHNGQKYYIKTDFPTFLLSYKKDFSGGDRLSSSFDNIEATVYQTVRINLFSQFFYFASAGAFLSAQQTWLPDYKHFHSNESFLSSKSFNTSFTMDNYRYATNKRWMQVFANYSSQYLLIKQIPFLQRALIDEAVHLKILWTPDVNHNEAGYSIGLGNLSRVGVFVSFRKQRYEGVGFVLTLPLFDLFSQ